MNLMFKIIASLFIYLISNIVASETVTYYINDISGSPMAAMDQSGNILWRESYNPYGEGRKKPSQNKNDIGFTGHQKDDFSGLTYMQARYYDPVIGRFYSNDPKDTQSFLAEGKIQGFNRYAYAFNNPYKYTDPDGKNPRIERRIKPIVKTVAEALGGKRAVARVEARFTLMNSNASVKEMTKALDVYRNRVTKGLETRGYKPQPGERTIQGQVDAATQAGNPTVQRGGQDLFRLRSSGHGQAGATATPQNVRNVTPDGRVFTGKGPDRAVTPRDIRELYKAQTEQGTSTVRTRSGR
ncbi:RHS repeat-associated core domain-containing protein [Pleionea mediterranea]|uniref:RHS repeat-associated protein n=1 Tax=Pleionea mediterranea TaxID=523701 RepID=A0A316FZM7_9GAMM|nr:RHS repeat-associated core domain-containing protein [Pleionea mediterranea]PWK53842.1 RHS repeat-associated protein [Pleionea mediterranea]